MAYFVYVIKNDKTGKTYTGQTENILKRLDRDNGLLPNKKSGYTNKNLNNSQWILIYSQEYSTRQEAKVREKELKSYQGRLFTKRKLVGRSASRRTLKRSVVSSSLTQPT